MSQRTAPRGPRAPLALRVARQRIIGQTRRDRERRRQLQRRRLALLGFLALLGLVASIGGGLVAVLGVTTIGIMPPARSLPTDSFVYDRKGRLIAQLHPDGESRVPVALSDIAPAVQQATVDIEDRNFWHEGAVDVARVGAAAWHDLSHDTSPQGASTITMQLGKVIYLEDDQSLGYKAREIAVARHLDSTLTKPQILNAYLNDIPYGRGATGIGAAAHLYFGVDASRLDLAQAAILAGLPNAPTDLDPILHPREAAIRQRDVLVAMLAAGDITDGQYYAALTEPLHFARGTVDTYNRAPAFVARVVDEVQRLLNLDARVAGLRITSTLDLDLQTLAATTVAGQVAQLHRYNASDGALVSMVPSTGDVVAYVGNGGPSVPGASIDMAAHPRQPGSTFKLITYSRALADRRISMLTPVLDGPLTLPTGGGPTGDLPYSPLDYDLRFHGVLPVQVALGNSLNVPAIRVELLEGMPKIVEQARAYGVTTMTEATESYGPSMTLGAYPIPLWQMAQIAAALGDLGVLHPARFVTSVRTSTGAELITGAPTPQTVIDPAVAYIMSSTLGDDTNRIMEFGAHGLLTLPGHIVAAKTGTSQDFRDNLTVGWTPELATATWVGNASDAPMHGTTGITGAAPIWHAFMEQALQGVPDNWPPAPAGVTSVWMGGHHGWLLSGTSPQTGAAVLLGNPLGLRGCRSRLDACYLVPGDFVGALGRRGH